MPNDYSPEWFDTFVASIPERATDDEVAFVARQLPVAAFPDLLDLCCGPARHARALTRLGYRVVGVDRDEDVIRQARARCPGADFRVGDMRALDSREARFDAVVNLWHSFGYFDDAVNLDVLRQVRGVLRPQGRAIFDIYNREHFASRPAEEIAERAGRRIRTTRSWNASRQRVSLEYDGREGDVFEWRLYSPAEFGAICATAGLEVLRTCAWFDEAILVSAEHARMQFVVERSG